MIKLSIKKVSMILISVILIINFGCLNRKTLPIHDCSHSVSLNDEVQYIESVSDIKAIVLDQISADLPKFTEDNYISFVDIRSFPGLEEWRISREEVVNIYVSYKLLNSFTLVFAQTTTDSIINSIQQTDLIKKPKENHCYYIYLEYLLYRFEEGKIDIYGFNNDKFVFRDSFIFKRDSTNGNFLIDY